MKYFQTVSTAYCNYIWVLVLVVRRLVVLCNSRQNTFQMSPVLRQEQKMLTSSCYFLQSEGRLVFSDS